jgi:hypothetical protein
MNRGRLRIAFICVVFGLLASWYMGLIRPPRPYFCNHFELREGPPWPTWGYPSPERDVYGQFAWTDHDYNVLLIALTGIAAPSHDQTSLYNSGRDAALWVGDSQGGKRVPIPRARNALFLVTADKRLQQLELPTDIAAKFDASFHQNPSAYVDQIDRLRNLLDKEHAKALDSALKDYQRPMPHLPTRPSTTNPTRISRNPGPSRICLGSLVEAL